MRVDEADRRIEGPLERARLRGRLRVGRDLHRLRPEPAGAGTELRFRHHGLTPQLECFEMCLAGWTHYLASLVDYVDRGTGTPNPPADVARFAA